MNTEFDKIDRATSLLIEISHRLGFELTAPAIFQGCPKAALAYIPDFGSPEGILIDWITPPNYEGDDTLQALAERQQMFYSKVNIDALINFADDDFIDMFRDWGYFGDTPPSWF